MNYPTLHKKLLGMIVLPAYLLAAPTSPSAQEGDPAAGEKIFRKCASCHRVGEGAKNATGPVLNGIVGRQTGSYEGYKYSKSLISAGENGLVWSSEAIFDWLANPRDFIRAYTGDPMARTKMSFKLGDEQQRRDVIAYLGTLSPQDAAADGSSMSHGDTPFDDKMAAGNVDPLADMERVRQELVLPPNVPQHDQVAKGDPKIVEIELIVEEKPWMLDSDGTTVVALTYNGSIPAPMLIVHQDDIVELTLKNPDSNLMEHNIDLHAATGALGGAGITTIAPGEESMIRFKATKTGTFLYHCAPEGSMTPYHVTHGMTGAITVLPRDGIKDENGKLLTYDKMYYVGENDFYVPRDENGDFKTYEDAGEDLGDWIEVMKTLLPSHVVFNGRVGALTGENAMTSEVGETVMFVHVTANRDSRPHLIGGHLDYAWETGSFISPPLRDLETMLVRGGSAGAAMYTFLQPGVYAYLNHNLIEAVELGAAGHVVVKGEWNDELMQQVYLGPLK